MISLNHILPGRNGIEFTNHYKEQKEIFVKFIETYTGLCFWGTKINILSGASHFASYPRITKLMTFLIEDSQTGETLLKICDYSDVFQYDIRNFDPENKLQNIGINLPKNDLTTGLVLFEIFLNNEYDHEYCKVEPGDVVVDIGSNIGLFSYFSITQGANQVHSFEPDPNLSSFIQTNFGDLPIRVNNLALWSEKKDLSLDIHECRILNSVSVSYDHTGESVSCQGIVLEDWARESGVKIDFLKIDCEGCEWEVLPTMSPEFLRSIPKIVLEYHNHPPDQLLLIFSENGFQTYHTGNMIWAWRNKNNKENRPQKTELCSLFEKWGSDKCREYFHTYSEEYYNILKDTKHTTKQVLEIGIGYFDMMVGWGIVPQDKYNVGASLRAWRDFFPGGKIWGIDIREDVLFEDERIKCLWTDQSSSIELDKTIENIKTIEGNDYLEFDLIVDDGSHVVEHQITSIKTLSKYLKTGGYYIIEDMADETLDIFSGLQVDGLVFIKFFSEWIEKIPGGNCFVLYQKV